MDIKKSRTASSFHYRDGVYQVFFMTKFQHPTSMPLFFVFIPFNQVIIDITHPKDKIKAIYKYIGSWMQKFHQKLYQVRTDLIKNVT